jgi:polyphenol oxidase
MTPFAPEQRPDPHWQAPSGVKALITTRTGSFLGGREGVSAPPFDSFNLGAHVGDDAAAVVHNRALLARRIGATPVFLNQVHGRAVLDLDNYHATGESHDPPVADAVITTRRMTPCVVMVADCLPLLLASGDGSVVGAVHCGWRGILGGVAGVAISAMRAKLAATPREPCEIVAYMGPAIGPAAFEVGAEVREQFVVQNSAFEAAFTLHKNTPERTTYLANIYLMLSVSLHLYAIKTVACEHFCTYSDAERFFSFRRDGRTGRQAAAVWIA